MFTTPSTSNASSGSSKRRSERSGRTEEKSSTGKHENPVLKTNGTPVSLKNQPSHQRRTHYNSFSQHERTESIELKASKKKFKAMIAEIPSEIQTKLKKNYVNIVDKIEKNNRIAFHCDPCSSNFNTLAQTLAHVETNWLHLYKMKLRRYQSKVYPQKEHSELLTNLLEEVYKNNAATEDDYDRWNSIAEELQIKLREVLETIIVEPAGLQGCGLALKSKTLNLRLGSTEQGRTVAPSKLLATLWQKEDLAQRCGLTFERQDEDTIRLVRKAYFQYSKESEPVAVTLSVMCLDPTTKNLLNIYRRENPYILGHLAVAFQYWAQLVGFFANNCLSPEALAVMVVHFLQHCPQPVFPILNPGEIHERVNFNTSNQSTLGQFWVAMLYYFSYGFGYDKFAVDIVSPRGKLSLRDPEAKHSNRRRLFVNTAQAEVTQRFNLARLLKPDLMFDFFHDRLMECFHYFATLPANRNASKCKLVHDLADQLEEHLHLASSSASKDESSLSLDIWTSQLINGVVDSSIDKVTSPKGTNIEQILKFYVIHSLF